MRRALLLSAVAALALGVVPAGADEGPPLKVCDTAGATVLTEADLSGAFVAPSFPQGVSSKEYILDLSPAVEGEVASVAVRATWELPTNDYDMEATAENGAAGESINLQPIDGPEEAVSLGELLHCERFTVTLSNFAAPLTALDAITMAITAERP